MLHSASHPSKTPTLGNSASTIGYGKSFASFGELAQGRGSDNTDFLFTLPIDLWSTCTLTSTRIDGPLVLDCELEKSRAALLHFLKALGISRGFHMQCSFTQNIPVGKGLSSSTADMLAAVRALQGAFGLLFSEEFISEIFQGIEPHDALQFNSTVAYNHRRGTLLQNFAYIPNYTIVVLDLGGEVDTMHYNTTLEYSPPERRECDAIFAGMTQALTQKNPELTARFATRSARLHGARTNHPQFQAVLEQSGAFGPMGIVATHSGTCLGFLYRGDQDPAKTDAIAQSLKDKFDCAVFSTHTLHLL